MVSDFHHLCSPLIDLVLGSLLLNEIAPRPHNSGHHTIEACHTSQFENHLRAILSLPLGSTSLRVPCAGMVNILGSSSSMSDIDTIADSALSVLSANVHLYGKSESRKARKMGHITLTANSDAELRTGLRELLLAQADAGSWIDEIAPLPPKPGFSHRSAFSRNHHGFRLGFTHYASRHKDTGSISHPLRTDHHFRPSNTRTNDYIRQVGVKKGIKSDHCWSRRSGSSARDGSE